MEDKNTFEIKFDQNWFNRKDILTISEGVKVEILETPHRKWYKVLLQFITFRLYKVPYQYKVKIIEKK